MSFHLDKYTILREVISPELAKFITEYFMLKKQVARTMFDTRYLPDTVTEFGVWNDPQVPNTFSHYADIAMETLLTWVQPVMEEHTGLELIPTYSYARIYKKGDVLERHRDRFSCEISTTMNLGGDPWPIYLEPKIKVDLLPGDMLIYSGCELDHWRDEFKGTNCAQVFLHYNRKTKESEKNKFDQRFHLGLPAGFKNL